MATQKIATMIAAIDLEAGSDAVLARAMQLASLHEARLVVLHVIETEGFPQIASPAQSDICDELKRHALEMIHDRVVEGSRATHTDCLVEFGSPHEIVTRLANERHADLLVIGPGKARSVRERFLGSTADRVIRAGAAPVLVVRRHSDEPYRHIAAAVDFSPQSMTALEQARRLAPHASMLLVHAVETPLSFAQAMLRVGTPSAEIKRYRAARIATARRKLSDFMRDRFPDGDAAIRVIGGPPGPALSRLSRGGRIDLVALGPHGQGVVRNALLGSVTQQVLKEAGCDVLVAGGA